MGSVQAQFPFSPSELFANNEVGAWYDPSDFSTMFQDAAGTTPVTAVEQPVGKILDKSGRGNHASQTTLAARPVLSARVNLLTYTEQFDNAAWTNTTLVTANSTVAPDGTTTADTLTSNGTLNYLPRSITSVSEARHTLSISLKYTNNQWVVLQLSDSGATHRARVWFDIKNGVKGTSQTTGSGVVVGYSIESQGNGWYRCSLTATNPITTLYSYFPQLVTGDGVLTVAANLQSCYLWGADLRAANDGVGLPDYQRVGAATGYATTGFPLAIYLDKTDDHVTSATGGGSTTAFFFCASIRCNAVGATQTIYSDTGTNTGYRIRINSSNQLEMAVGNGSAYTTVNTTATLSLGQRAVITCWHDGTTIYAQIDQGTIASTAFGTATAGTAGFTLGRDNGAASSYFGGSLYEYIHSRDANVSDAQRGKSQKYVAAFGKISL